CMQALQSPFAF
nr:immunoglobulin light chain junction region [Macaca mulatta]MPN98451.1 immunoglobulin light chain junction region [Macaca mulatta]